MRAKKLTKRINELTEAKMDQRAQIAGDIINAMIGGKFKGSVDQLIDSFDADFDILSENPKADEEEIAEILIDLYKALTR